MDIVEMTGYDIVPTDGGWLITDAKSGKRISAIFSNRRDACTMRMILAIACNIIEDGKISLKISA
jgi:hypothetical protein